MPDLNELESTSTAPEGPRVKIWAQGKLHIYPITSRDQVGITADCVTVSAPKRAQDYQNGPTIFFATRPYALKFEGV